MGAARAKPLNRGGPGAGARIFLAAMAFGILGEALLFMSEQCRRVEAVLVSDLRVLAFLGADMPDSRAQVTAEKLRGLAGVADVKYVSREAALLALQERDPELVRSVAMLGENPLYPAFEVRFQPDAVSRMPDWVREAAQLPELTDIRFKPAQVAAIVQVQFYGRLLALVLSLGAFAWFLASAAGALALLRAGEASPAEVASGVLWAGAGAVAGMAFVYAAAVPMSSDARLWAWPSAGSQALLAAAGALGARLIPDWSAPPRRLQAPEPAEPEAVGDLAAS